MSFHAPEKYRQLLAGSRYQSDASFGNNGVFVVPSKDPRGGKIEIICGEGLGWEHVSVKLRNRTPTWEEMCQIKALFWDPQDCVVQYHPPEAVYINTHSHVLHLWRPIGVEFPMPMEIMV